jgi:hypothetical protein
VTARVALRLAVLAASCCALAVAGCGEGAQKREAQKLVNASVLSRTAPLRDRLVEQTEIDAASDSSAQRTFLQLWSFLQYQAWDQAEELFEPGLREKLGASLLAQALENDVLVWQSTKPHIVSARLAGGTATISFLSRNETDAVVPSAISFAGSPGRWRVSYFGLLNPAIARTAEQRVQARVDPLATKPSPEAITAADRAAKLQGDYLERKLAAGGKRAKR